MESFRVDARTVLQVVGIIIFCGLLVQSAAAGIMVGLFWLLPILICDQVGAKKNRGGFWWGLCLGWLGVIIVCCLGRVPTADELSRERMQQELQIRALQRQLGERA